MVDWVLVVGGGRLNNIVCSESGDWTTMFALDMIRVVLSLKERRCFLERKRFPL